jgi:hypothetical protein
MVSKGRNMVMDTGITAPLFAAPSIAAAQAGDGSLLLRSTEPLADYPVSVMHSVRTRIERLLVMARPADLDAGEITDKGYVNQRQVLANRAALVELLYTEPVPAGVVVAGRTA